MEQRICHLHNVPPHRTTGSLNLEKCLQHAIQRMTTTVQSKWQNVAPDLKASTTASMLRKVIHPSIRLSLPHTHRCSCALFTAFKPELRAAGLFELPDGEARIQQASSLLPENQGSQGITRRPDLI
eukprot:1148252-Pelagomonas_calceolata.AAC.4